MQVKIVLAFEGIVGLAEGDPYMCTGGRGDPHWSMFMTHLPPPHPPEKIFEKLIFFQLITAVFILFFHFYPLLAEKTCTCMRRSSLMCKYVITVFTHFVHTSQNFKIKQKSLLARAVCWPNRSLIIRV